MDLDYDRIAILLVPPYYIAIVEIRYCTTKIESQSLILYSKPSFAVFAFWTWTLVSWFTIISLPILIEHSDISWENLTCLLVKSSHQHTTGIWCLKISGYETSSYRRKSNIIRSWCADCLFSLQIPSFWCFNFQRLMVV